VLFACHRLYDPAGGRCYFASRVADPPIAANALELKIPYLRASETKAAARKAVETFQVGELPRGMANLRD